MHCPASAGDLRGGSGCSITGQYHERADPERLAFEAQSSQANALGSTLNDVLVDLDRQYPGIRFRIIDEQQRVRRHIRIFINGVTADSLAQTTQPDDEVIIVQALSGG
jgi:hypothetical protein